MVWFPWLGPGLGGAQLMGRLGRRSWRKYSSWSACTARSMWIWGNGENVYLSMIRMIYNSKDFSTNVKQAWTGSVLVVRLTESITMSSLFSVQSNQTTSCLFCSSNSLFIEIYIINNDFMKALSNNNIIRHCLPSNLLPFFNDKQNTNKHPRCAMKNCATSQF